ncbi:MAG: hypothetical protein ACTHMY_14585 [Solirubrobacteraceae bacterium]
MTPAETDLHPDTMFDDSGGGLAMFLVFSSAVLIVTGGVALMALVGTWWIFGLAFAIHVLMTTVVVATIVLVMNGRLGNATDGPGVEQGRRYPRARPHPLRWLAGLS